MECGALEKIIIPSRNGIPAPRKCKAEVYEQRVHNEIDIGSQQ